jgi:3-deoxy-D-arabino-heptulosonate 7-phosphate (DAHP) synthase
MSTQEQALEKQLEIIERAISQLGNTMIAMAGFVSRLPGADQVDVSAALKQARNLHSGINFETGKIRAAIEQLSDIAKNPARTPAI